jgi:hypothetical protein
MFQNAAIVSLSVLLAVAMLGCDAGDGGTSKIAPPDAPTVAVKTPKVPEPPKAPAENVVPRIDPKMEKGLISPDTEVMVTLTVRNKTAGTLTMYWLDEIDGERVPYRDVEAGKELLQDTWEGHYWIVVDQKGKNLGIYKTPSEDGVIIVK